jgi:hypothetical protein
MKHHSICNRQRRITTRLTSALAGLALLAGAVAPALAGPGNLGNTAIAPPQSHFRGRTYSEWSAAAFQWLMSLPYTHHPLFDTADCSEGQSGHVWFIDGRLGAGGPIVRSCTIPAGTALFLMIAANGPVDNTGCAGDAVQLTNFTIDELRAFARDNLEGFLDDRGMAEVDGVLVDGLSGFHTPYRAQSTVFSYTVPPFDNILELINGACYRNPPAAALRVDEAVADGVYVMIKPLSVGQHTIRFGNPRGIPLGSVYHITVTGGKN